MCHQETPTDRTVTKSRLLLHWQSMEAQVLITNKIQTPQNSTTNVFEVRTLKINRMINATIRLGLF